MQPQDPALQPLWDIFDANWGAPPAVNQDGYGYALANDDDDEDGGSGGGMASAGECEPEESPAALADAAESFAPIMTEESQPLTPTVLEDSQVVAETTLDSPTVPEMDGLELDLDQDSQPRNDIGVASLAAPTESPAASPSDARSDTASDSCGHTGASRSKDMTEILKKIQQARWRLLPGIVFGLGSKVNFCCNHSLAYHCLSREPWSRWGMGYPSFGPPIVHQTIETH